MKKTLKMLLISSVTIINMNLCFANSDLAKLSTKKVVMAKSYTYNIPATGQTNCYDKYNQVIKCPLKNQALYGQDAQFQYNKLRYQDNHDGTVTDLITGLMWEKKAESKMYWQEAKANARNVKLGGYGDWRLPTIKELYSLIDFNGSLGYFPQKSMLKDGNVPPQNPNIHNSDITNNASTPPNSSPYIDTQYFDFSYGDSENGERDIDTQEFSATSYNGNLADKQLNLAFGVNFADGRIKGYSNRDNDPIHSKHYVRYVRGNTSYGKNNFVDNKNGTVYDATTGLTWLQSDSGNFKVGDKKDGALTWTQALKFCTNLNYAGHKNWRLPNAKELQSIVDYSRSPEYTNSAAIAPIFKITSIVNEKNEKDWPWFWTNTTHLDGPYGTNKPGSAIYVSFGKALGYFSTRPDMEQSWINVHGAGAQRSSPKYDDGEKYPNGFGPQGDAVRSYNYARCVYRATNN